MFVRKGFPFDKRRLNLLENNNGENFFHDLILLNSVLFLGPFRVRDSDRVERERESEEDRGTDRQSSSLLRLSEKKEGL